MIDVSGSMGEAADPDDRARPSSTWPSEAAINALDQFKDRRRGRPARLLHRPRRQRRADELRRPGRARADDGDQRGGAATADPGPGPDQRHAALHGRRRPATRTPSPTYDAEPHQRRRAAHRRRNDDGDAGRRRAAARRAARHAAATAARARRAEPVRVFPIAYGGDADLGVAPARSPRRRTPPPTTPATPRRSTRSSPPSSPTSERRAAAART